MLTYCTVCTNHYPFKFFFLWSGTQISAYNSWGIQHILGVIQFQSHYTTLFTFYERNNSTYMDYFCVIDVQMECKE